MSDKPNFTGNAEQKALAAQIFQLMSSQGAFFASDSPIKQSLANLADFIAVQSKADRAKVVQEIDAALSKNHAVFARGCRGRVARKLSRGNASSTGHQAKQRKDEPG